MTSKNFNVPLLNIDGEAVQENGKDALVKTAVINALLGVDDAGGEEKAKRYMLALDVKNDKEDYMTEDLALIKKLVGKFFPPMTVGQIYEIIEK